VSSPFEQYNKRIFLCYGNTRDRFCAPTCSVLRFDEFLHLNLKSLGYERILYYSHQGLYFYDEFSQQSTMHGVSRPKKKKVRQPSAPPLSPGGLSLRRKKNKPANQNTSADKKNIRWKYPDMPGTEIIKYFKRLMFEEDPSTAIIFYSDHLDGFFDNHSTAQQFRGMLETDFRSLQLSNHNIIIFVFGYDATTLTESLGGKPWDFLFGLDQDGKIRGISHPVLISCPEKDEVERLFHSYRLTRNLEIDWKQFSGIINAVAANLKKETLMLNSLEKWLETKTNSSDKKLDSLSIKNFLGKSIEDKAAHERLEERLEGLTEIKKMVDDNINLYKNFLKYRPVKKNKKSNKINISRLNLDRGKHPLPPNFNIHLALKGNPGTGKTTVAKLISEIYRDAGILELGHTLKVTRDDLVGRFVGDTAIKTKAKIEQAMGGVLFIDEAYTLIQGGENDYGRESLNTILEAMSDRNGQFSVIMAGYPDEIDKVIASNDGFESRFGNILTIDDFEPEVLEKIFRNTCRDYFQPIMLDAELDKALPGFFKEVCSNKEKKFGNARVVKETIFGEMVKHILPGADGIRIAKKEHFPDKYRKYFELSEADPAILNELEELIGLENVKTRINELILDKKMQKKRAQATGKDESNIKYEPGHYIFAGNPGTGKTTAADMMAAQLKRIGLLKTDKIVKCSASDLSKGHIGGTEVNTIKIIQEAIDKGTVCFIDEAHQLADEHSYGKQALNSIIPFVSRHEKEFSLIFAGYADAIENIFKTDRGLRRRFEIITFEDYDPQELTSIFYFMAEKDDLAVSPDARPVLSDLFQMIYDCKSSDFGNAGTIKQILKITRTNMNKRLRTIKSPTKDDLLTILVVDIPQFEDIKVKGLI